MKDLFADHIVRAVRTLDRLKEEGAEVEERIALLNMLRHDFGSIGLGSAVAQIDRIKTSLRSVKNPDPLALQIKELEARYLDELKATPCFFLPRDQAKYWSERPLFGAEVFERFPSATVDIEEAGKCLACHRGTAAVFHLMRVMEVGLRATARALKVPYQNDWGSYLREIKSRMDQKSASKGAAWKKQEPFFREVHSYLHAVKLAWRNPTMHIEQSYTPEMAEDTYSAVRGFMRHLATKLSERPIKKR